MKSQQSMDSRTHQKAVSIMYLLDVSLLWLGGVISPNRSLRKVPRPCSSFWNKTKLVLFLALQVLFGKKAQLTVLERREKKAF